MKVTMKVLDKLMIKSFIPPFVVSFGIAIFVLLMQNLWMYIDDIMGKGASFFMIIEMIGYMSLAMFPLAISIAVLLASVLVMGNLAEKYELVAIKSAGTPLLRVMKPLVFVAGGLAIFSFLCSNYFIPVANLKFKSRLYDIRTQKPALSLEEGVFSYDFSGYVMRINEKDENGHLKDILIYDHKSNKGETFSSVVAKEGRMYASEDGNFLVMNLKEGWQYQELKNEPNKFYPFVRIKFKEWTKVFDLSEFRINSTDENLFKSHQTMLNVNQLMTAMDSMERKRVNEHSVTFENLSKQIDLLKPKESRQLNNSSRRPPDGPALTLQLPMVDEPFITTIDSFTSYQQRIVKDRYVSSVKSLSSKMNHMRKVDDDLRLKIIKHTYELNTKFSIATACFVFLFIGAPMGAIIRKGGFGYPILVAIVFFTTFLLMTVSGRKIAEAETLPTVLVAWMPTLILFPIGIYLTIQAMQDAKLVPFAFVSRWANWFNQRTKRS